MTPMLWRLDITTRHNTEQLFICLVVQSHLRFNYCDYGDSRRLREAFVAL